MPSEHEKVETPPELDKRIIWKEREVTHEAPWWLAIVSLLLMVSASVLVGVGMGLWVGLGAGLTCGGIMLFIIAFLMAYDSGEGN